MMDLFDRAIPAPPRPDAPPKCKRYAVSPTHACRVAGGEASLTDNGGLTWFCAEHAPEGFWPDERKR